MPPYTSEIDQIISQIADRTGVGATDVKKVLGDLGIDYAVESVARIAGSDKLSRISSDNVVVGIRYENVVVAK
jgi:hypothetical protein